MILPSFVLIVVLLSRANDSLATVPESETVLVPAPPLSATMFWLTCSPVLAPPPVPVVTLTLPALASRPLTPSTELTVNPSESVKLMLPVPETSTASTSTSLSSFSVTAAAAVMARLVSVIVAEAL